MSTIKTESQYSIKSESTTPQPKRYFPRDQVQTHVFRSIKLTPYQIFTTICGILPPPLESQSTTSNYISEKKRAYKIIDYPRKKYNSNKTTFYYKKYKKIIKTHSSGKRTIKYKYY